jgi:multidrug efflux pump subunit AcrA (membrane-fusion protein)
MPLEDDLRSDSVQEIISARPGFWERWSIWLFLLVFLSLVTGAWLIKYPDIIQANARLTAANGPKEIVVRHDGRLVKLLAGNNDTVTAGQVIGWIESTANHEQVIDLAGLLEQASQYLSKDELAAASTIFYRKFDQLGELQSAYQQFITAWQQFDDYLINGYYYKRKKGLTEDLIFLRKDHRSIERQKTLTEQEAALEGETFDTNQSLFKEKVISAQDLRVERSKLLDRQIGIPRLESSLNANESQQLAKQREIDELDHAISRQKIIFQQALQTLHSLVADWEKQYLLTTPVAGKIVFIVPLQENQVLPTGKVIGYINPPDSRYYAEVTLSQNNLGKIKVGQKVQLRFDAYPYPEFGYVWGELSYISAIPADSGFRANITLPQALMTNYKKQIQYSSGLRCTALIITRDSRLISRFYYKMVKASQQ